MNDMWKAYQYVNVQFVSELLELKKEDDMIWVHNLYLLLVPLLLKKRDISANIGFSLHTPFPSSDVFKTCQFRLEILKSLLCCDLIGFHIFEYARNFYYACQRLIRVDLSHKKGGHLVIGCNGRNIVIKVNHIGVNQEDVR